LRVRREPVSDAGAEADGAALLDRIVAAPAHPAPAPAHRGRIAWRPRAALAALAAAAAVAAALTLPNLAAGPAYASWTPQPSPLAAADQDQLADRCVAQVAGEYQSPEADPAARVVHGERRGDYAYLSVVTPGWSALCFRDQGGTLRNASIMMAPVTATALGGTGVEMQGWPQMRTAEGHCRLMSGHVGSQVVGVDITVRARSGDHSRTVRATVEDGYFLAWYPEQLGESSSNTTSLTLRLADGRTVEGLSARELMEAPRMK
jgi:hypothetical protein